MKRNIRKEESAVSPVIGVILMVAITVILAAVIGAFVFGMGGSVKKTYNVGVTATQTGSGTVDVTFQGGPDADLVTYLNVSIGTDKFDTNGSTTGYPTFENPVNVGDMVTCTSTQITSGRDHVIVTAKFADGSEQIVLDTYV